MTLNWRQALTSALVGAIVVVGADALLGLFGHHTDPVRALSIGLAIGASRLIEKRQRP